MDIKNLFNKIKNPSFYVVDIGASFGVNSNPVFDFIIDKKFKGLCIEGDSDKVAVLKTKTDFNIYDGYITPLNALSIFENYKVPYIFDILKIDIDGYDLELLRSILKIYKPKIIIAEINEKIPPPICFEVKFKEDYSWDTSHFYGFSIQSGAKFMNDNNYKILSIYDINNILCIDDELCKSLEIENNNTDEYITKLYKKEYIDNVKRLGFWWNKDVNHWLNITDNEILKHKILDYFVNNNDRSNLAVKTKIKDIDFTIE